MSYQVLARKWRPRTFDELVGQEAVVQALVNGLDNDRVHHAFLFTGTRGVGKTTLARILAKCLNCETGVTSKPCGECSSCVDIDEGRFMDMLEIDAASRTKVDDTRDLLESVPFAPSQGRYKVYIIDEVHMLSTASFNALLKTLEEPPPHVKFVLATTNAQKIPVTILSRCLRFNLRRLLPSQISGYLTGILKTEGVKAEEAAVERIARAADGSMRDALSLMDQAIAYGGGELKDEEVAQMMGSVDHAHIAGIIGAVSAGDTNQLLEIVGELSAQARDLESVLGELAEVLHRVGLVQLASDYRDPARSDWDSILRLAETLSPEDAQLYYQIAVLGKRDLGLAPDPRTGLEMTLLRMIAFRPQATAGSTDAKSGSASGSGSGQGSTVTESVASQADPAKAPVAAATRLTPVIKAPPGEPAPTAADLGQPPKGAVTDQEWHSLILRLELTGPVKELARNMHLESTSEGNWQFLIPDAVRHLGSTQIVEKLQTALSSQLGQPVHLAVHTASEPVSTPAAISEQTSHLKMSEAERSIEEDPTVQSLKERFDAQIIPDSIQPLQ